MLKKGRWGIKFDPTFNYGSSDLSDDRNLALYKFAELIKNLIALSSNAERQIEIIGYVAVCDKMAEDFHTYFKLSFNAYVKYGLMETDQVVKLTDLDVFLEQRRGDKSPEFWDDLMLATNQEWNVVRHRYWSVQASLKYFQSIHRSTALPCVSKGSENLCYRKLAYKTIT